MRELTKHVCTYPADTMQLYDGEMRNYETSYRIMHDHANGIQIM